MKVLINTFLYKEIWSQCYINTWRIYTAYTLYQPYVRRRRQGGKGATALPIFLEYLVILCFKREYLKQNTVARRKSNVLTHPKFSSGFQGRIWLMWGPRLIHLWSPLSHCCEEKMENVAKLRKWRSESTVSKKFNLRKSDNDALKAGP